MRATQRKIDVLDVRLVALLKEMNSIADRLEDRSTANRETMNARFDECELEFDALAAERQGLQQMADAEKAAAVRLAFPSSAGT